MGYVLFTIERNPWDRAISLYYWRTRNYVNPISLREHLEEVISQDPQALTNWGHYTIDKEIAVDRVLLFETLPQELPIIAGILGLPSVLSIDGINAKTNIRKDRRPYQELFGTEEKELVSRFCQNEIRAFGYDFEDRIPSTS